MAEPLKEMFNAAYFARLAGVLARVIPGFPARKFVRDALDRIDARELNARMRHASHVLRQYLPAEFPAALNILRAVAPEMPGGYTALLFPDFTGEFGLDHFGIALPALAFFTRFGSSEFAVRKFFLRDPDRTMAAMQRWSRDPCEHVRRLASESSRPRLPWSFRLDAVIRDPALTRPILDTLRDDPSLYVRKSVANHLNDISRDHPDYVPDLLRTWDLRRPETGWIARHACRTLIKAGHPGALALLAFEKNTAASVEDLRVSPPRLRAGGELEIRFTLRSGKSTAQKLAVDYRIHYVRAAGRASAKVFKLKEVMLAGGAAVPITKRQTIRDFTTRKHYPGRHELEVLVNGTVMARGGFDLVP